MKKVKINFNSAPSSMLYSQVNALAKTLEHPLISQQNTQRLYQKLDQMFACLFELPSQQMSLFEQNALEEIEKKMISLYRQIDDAWVQSQVLQIEHETLSLKQSFNLGGVSSEAVQTLHTHIQELIEDHRPSVAVRQVIAEAKETLKLISDPSLRLKTPHSVNSQLEAGEFEEILEIAHAFYDGKLREAKRAYAELPDEHQRRIQEHTAFLGGVLFVDYWATLKALFATTNELVGNGELYPSQDLIEDIFVELNALTKDETLPIGA